MSLRLRRRMMGGGVQPETDALLARMSVQPSADRKTLINNLILALKSSGVYSKFDLLYILAAHDQQASDLNWINSSFTLGRVNTPTWTVDRGYTGDAVGMELTTGYAPATNAVQVAQNSAHVGAFTLTTSAAAGFDFAAVLATTPFGVRSINSVGSSVGRVNSTNNVLSTSAPGVPLHTMGIRRDAANMLLFHNGVQNNTAAQASGGLTAATISGLRGNNNWSDRQNAIWHCGAALSDQEALAAYNAFLAYLQGVGAA